MIVNINQVIRLRPPASPESPPSPTVPEKYLTYDYDYNEDYNDDEEEAEEVVREDQIEEVS
jgi:hypothetical protein